MVMLGEFAAEFALRIDRRIHFATQPVLSGPQRRYNLAETHFPHHEHVHIAVASSRTCDHRTVKKSNPDAVGKFRERGPEYVGYTDSLNQ